MVQTCLHLADGVTSMLASYGGRWNRQPSLRLTGSYRDEISRYSRTLVQAGSSDELVGAWCPVARVEGRRCVWCVMVLYGIAT